MAMFCDPDDLDDALGEHSFTSDELVAFCTRASGRTQEAAGDYWGFPDYNATVPTPETVREAAFNYALFLALEKQGQDNRLAENGSTLEPRARFDELTEFLRTDPEALAPITITGEALAFGTLDVSGYENAHVFANQDVEIWPTTVRIDGYQNKVQFEAKFDAYFDRWLLWRYVTDIVDDMQVRYRYSYRKRREIDNAPTGSGGRIVLA